LAVSSDLTTKRKEAYRYIRHNLEETMYYLRDVTNVKLADALGGTSDLTSDLKEALDNLESGKANPTPKLVKAFKVFFLQLIPESTINTNLVDPFK
jgi:hypothetical protein